jgi:uncharacterized membrane protein HdeD (DUF308 family)
MEKMKSDKNTENSKKFYLAGFIFILFGLILINIDYSTLYYPIIGIGILSLVLGINETLKSI